MKRYRILLIGCGHMGEAHLKELYFREDVEITAVCDRQLSQAELFQRKYGAKHIGINYLDFLSEADVAIIATYPSSHLEILKDCIAHNVHVICEKPITATLEEGAEFIRLAQEAPVKILVGYILRHHASYRKIAEMIHNDAIGKPIIMRMTQNHHTMRWDKYLRLIEESSPIIDCGVHYFDVMRWFTGAEMKSIYGVGLRTESDVPEDKYNYGMVTVKMTDGSVGYYEAGWGNTIAAENSKEFVGPKGRIKLILARDRTSHQEEGDLIEFYQYPESSYTSINLQADRKPTGVQFDYLRRMIEENIPADPSLDDVYESFQIAIQGDAAIHANGVSGLL